MIEAAIHNAAFPRFAIEMDSTPTNFGESWSGHFLTVSFQGLDTKPTLFFGLDYTTDCVSVTIAFDQRLNRKLWDVLADSPALKNTPTFFRERDNKENSLYLRMPEDDFNRLNTEPDKEKQLDNLKGFLIATCKVFEKAIQARAT